MPIHEKYLARGPLQDQWQLFGKTGSFAPLGWFVGWFEKDNKTYIFAYLRNDEDIQAEPIARMEARVENAKAKLIIYK